LEGRVRNRRGGISYAESLRVLSVLAVFIKKGRGREETGRRER